MQENANAINVKDYAIKNFGGDNVSVNPDGVVRASLKAIANGDLLTISNMLQWADVLIKRSDKGLIVLLNPRPESTGMHLSYYDDIAVEIERTVKQSRVRDFFEKLPQEARIAAFDNTAKSKWDNPVNDLEEAILTSFYISDSHQGANYWQDVILENTAIKA